jgi:hypothetical protein
VEIGIVTAQFLFWEYLFRSFGIGSLQCMQLHVIYTLRSTDRYSAINLPRWYNYQIPQADNKNVQEAKMSMAGASLGCNQMRGQLLSVNQVRTMGLKTRVQ